MDQITITKWELAFLRSLAAPVRSVDEWCRRLDIPEFEPESELATSAFASLLLRQLARVEDDAVVVSPEVAATLVALSSAAEAATVVASYAEGADVAHVFIGAEQSLLVRPRAFGCFEISGLADDVSLADLLTLFVVAGEGVSALAASVQGRPEIEVRRVDDVFTLQVDGETMTTDRDGVVDAIRRRVDTGRRTGGSAP